MKVALVCGGHVGIDPVKVSTWLIDHYVEYGPFDTIVQGGATGADRGGELFALATIPNRLNGSATETEPVRYATARC